MDRPVGLSLALVVALAGGGLVTVAERCFGAQGPYMVVLGVGQDGGVPQAGDKDLAKWDDPERRHLVSSLGLVDPRDGRRWLFDATPDFPQQLVELDRIAPHEGTPGLAGIFLTHAHIGHYTGLMFIGHEGIGAVRTPVYAMPRMKRYLESNGPWDQLVRYENIELREMKQDVPVAIAPEIEVTALRVPHREEYSEVVGFRIEGPERSVLYLPDIDGWDDWEAQGIRIEDLLATVDVAYLDGTFFDNSEVPGRDMSGFPHPRISECIERFAPLPAAQRAKIRFIHLNHTNPALELGGEARRRVEAAGMRVAEEGEREDL